METGTLKELNVKPGDVVTFGNELTYEFIAKEIIGNRIHGTSYDHGRVYEDDWSLTATDNWRIISRAEQTPDLTAITTPFGLLDSATQEALRAHGGPYEYWSHLCKWTHTDGPAYDFKTVYRVKSAPVVETVTLDRSIDSLGCISMSSGYTPVRITFNRINGVIDLASYKVEPR